MRVRVRVRGEGEGVRVKGVMVKQFKLVKTGK